MRTRKTYVCEISCWRLAVASSLFHCQPSNGSQLHTLAADSKLRSLLSHVTCKLAVNLTSKVNSQLATGSWLTIVQFLRIVNCQQSASDQFDLKEHCHLASGSCLAILSSLFYHSLGEILRAKRQLGANSTLKRNRETGSWRTNC